MVVIAMEGGGGGPSDGGGGRHGDHRCSRGGQFGTVVERMVLVPPPCPPPCLYSPDRAGRPCRAPPGAPPSPVGPPIVCSSPHTTPSPGEGLKPPTLGNQLHFFSAWKSVMLPIHHGRCQRLAWSTTHRHGYVANPSRTLPMASLVHDAKTWSCCQSITDAANGLYTSTWLAPPS